MKFISEKNWLPTKKNWVKKTIRVMRLTVILLFTSVAQLLAVNTFSQGTKVTLECTNQPIKEVLKLIENQSEFLFLYNSKFVDVERKVNIQVKNQEIETIMNLLFAGSGVTHKLIDRLPILRTTLGLFLIDLNHYYDDVKQC